MKRKIYEMMSVCKKNKKQTNLKIHIATNTNTNFETNTFKSLKVQHFRSHWKLSILEIFGERKLEIAN